MNASQPSRGNVVQNCMKSVMECFAADHHHKGKVTELVGLASVKCYK